MLTNLFPTTFPVKDNYHDTFQENIKRLGTNVTTTSSSSNWLKKVQDFFSGKEEKLDDTVNGSLRYGGSIYSIVEVVLLNDILNNVFYQPFIQQVKLFNQWKSKQTGMLNTKKTSLSNKFTKLFADFKKELSPSKITEIDAEITEIIASFSRRSTGESPQRFQRLFNELKTANSEDDIRRILMSIEKINLA
jgi:hypothetical protein